jgi:hypothetical protein
LVAFELKLGKFKPEYISKMDFYLEALDRQKKKDNEKKTVIKQSSSPTKSFSYRVLYTTKKSNHYNTALSLF